MELRDCGALPLLEKLCLSSDPNLQESASLAIENLRELGFLFQTTVRF